MRLAAPVLALAACSFDHGVLPAPRVDAAIDVAIDTTTIDIDAPQNGCPATYTAMHGTSRYRVGQGSWYAAEAACEAEGTHLAVIDEMAENTFVLSLHPVGDIWIGMSDHRTEGMYLWVTGAMVDSGSPPWQVTQPNDAGGAEDCGEINAGGGWNDNGCTFSQTYICECDGVALPTTPTYCETGTNTSCDTCADNCTLMGEVCGAGQVCN